jgi:hypothetical protein
MQENIFIIQHIVLKRKTLAIIVKARAQIGKWLTIVSQALANCVIILWECP